MKWFNCVLIIILFGFFACEKKDPASPGTYDNDQIISEDVDFTGGTLSTGDFKLEIPLGAVWESTEINVYATSVESPFGGASVTPLFKIEGLPVDFYEPLRISMRYDGDLDGEAAAYLSEEVWDDSLEEYTRAHRPFAAEDSSGFLTFSIPASDPYDWDISKLSGRHQPFGEGTDLGVQGIKTPDRKMSSQGHFTVYDPDNVITQSTALEIIAELEDAYDTFNKLDFELDKREWPVAVNIEQARLWNFYYVPSWRGINASTIRIQAPQGGDLNSGENRNLFIRFACVAAALYDPENGLTQAWSGQSHKWFTWAVGTWAAEKDRTNLAYPSGLWKAPFNGFMEKDLMAGDYFHGIGMAAVIHYLTKYYGDGIIVKMYKQLKSGKTPIEAAVATVGSAYNWWPNFFIALFNLDEYNMFPTDNLLEMADDSYTISSDEDPGTSFTDQYPDLSARIYHIMLGASDFKEGTDMILTVDGGVSEILLFRLDNNTIIEEDRDTQKLTVEDLGTFARSNQDFMVIVPNSFQSAPHTYNSEITLTIEIEQEKEYEDPCSDTAYPYSPEEIAFDEDFE